MNIGKKKAKRLAKRVEWYQANIKRGIGTNGMAYHKPGSNKK